MISLTKQRDLDFVRRCIINAEKELSRCHKASTRRIALLTIYGEASSYYLNFERALKYVSHYRRLSPDALIVRQDDKPAVVRAKHISRRVIALMKEQDICQAEALTRVLACECAPRFYISVDTGMRILNRYTNQSTVYQPVKEAI